MTASPPAPAALALSAEQIETAAKAMYEEMSDAAFMENGEELPSWDETDDEARALARRFAKAAVNACGAAPAPAVVGDLERAVFLRAMEWFNAPEYGDEDAKFKLAEACALFTNASKDTYCECGCGGWCNSGAPTQRPSRDAGGEAEAGPRYLIQKGTLYYRSNFAGYTANAAEAGRYSKSEAESEASKEPWHMKAISENDPSVAHPPAPSAEAGRVGDWLPIDTAPKDGTSILLFGEPNEVPSLKPQIASGYWQPSDGLMTPGFWRWHHAVGPSFTITRWMPLRANAALAESAS